MNWISMVGISTKPCGSCANRIHPCWSGCSHRWSTWKLRLAIEELRTLARTFYSATSLSHHYYHMANNNYHQYIEGKPEVILKKYLYVLRPLVARLFLEQNQQIPPTH